MVWSITDMFFYTSLACYLSALAYPSSEIIDSYLLQYFHLVFLLVPVCHSTFLYIFGSILYVRIYLVLWKQSTFTQQYSHFYGIR